MFDYKPGSATAEYRNMVDRAADIAAKQKLTVDPIYHDKIDRLLDKYARKLADNLNHQNEITARVPSSFITGRSNFPTRAKEKQNAAAEKAFGEYNYIKGLVDKIQSIGTAGISADSPQALPQLEKQLQEAQDWHQFMKDTNAYYRKHKTLEGCPGLTEAEALKVNTAMHRDWRENPVPFPTYKLSYNSANMKRLQGRIEELKKRDEGGYTGWQFEGGTAEANKEANRLQLFFDKKPGDEQRATLKSNGFRWAPSVGAWQRQLNDNSFRAANRVDFIRPKCGKKPTELQPKRANKDTPER